MTFLKYIIICLASFLLITATGQAAAAKDVTVDGSILGENSREQAKQQVLTNDLLTLYGAKDSAEPDVSNTGGRLLYQSAAYT